MDEGNEEKEPEVKKNLYVIIKSSKEIKKSYSKTKETEMGTYKIIIANDAKTASEKVTKYLGETKADNIVVDAHGIRFTSGGVDSGNRGISTRPGVPKGQIHRGNVTQYLRSDQTKNENTQSQNEDVASLETMFNRVEEGGNFVFMNCNLGDDEKLMKALNRLSGGKITLYANKENTPAMMADGKIQLWTGKTPLSRTNGKFSIDEGWVKINSKIGLIKLKDQAGLSGSIYLNPLSNGNGIEETKTKAK